MQGSPGSLFPLPKIIKPGVEGIYGLSYFSNECFSPLLSVYVYVYVYVCVTLVFQHELREEVIEKVKWNINRDSPEDKLRDLLQWMKAVKRDTIHSVRCFSNKFFS